MLEIENHFEQLLVPNFYRIILKEEISPRLRHEISKWTMRLNQHILQFQIIFAQSRLEHNIEPDNLYYQVGLGRKLSFLKFTDLVELKNFKKIEKTISENLAKSKGQINFAPLLDDHKIKMLAKIEMNITILKSQLSAANKASVLFWRSIYNKLIRNQLYENYFIHEISSVHKG